MQFSSNSVLIIQLLQEKEFCTLRQGKETEKKFNLQEEFPNSYIWSGEAKEATAQNHTGSETRLERAAGQLSQPWQLSRRGNKIAGHKSDQTSPRLRLMDGTTLTLPSPEEKLVCCLYLGTRCPRRQDDHEDDDVNNI